MAANGAPPQIFLSHCSRDSELVAHVQRALEQAGSCRVYLAEDDPQPGEHLPACSNAIKESVAFVVLLTEAGAESTLVQQEVGAASNQGLPVVAVTVPGLATDLKALGLLAGQELIVADPANPAAALLDLQRWFQQLALRAQSGEQKPVPVITPAPRPGAVPPPLPHVEPQVAPPPTLVSASDSLVVLALILILAGIALYAITVSRQSQGSNP